MVYLILDVSVGFCISRLGIAVLYSIINFSTQRVTTFGDEGKLWPSTAWSESSSPPKRIRSPTSSDWNSISRRTM